MSKIRLHGTSSGYTEIAPVAASGNNTLTLPNDGTIISKDAAGAIGVTSVHTTNITATGIATITTAKIGVGVTITESGIEASGIGITCASINGTQIGGRRNLAINGAAMVAQRGASGAASQGYYSVDRFQLDFGSGTDENPSQSQSDVASGTTPYTLGFRKALKITNGNQTTSPASNTGLYFQILYKFEAQDIANSGWDYTNPNSFITLSFWVKSSVAQEFYARLQTSDGTSYNYPFSLGSLSANTWTKVVKTIPGNSNLQFDNNIEQGLAIEWVMYRGTAKTGSGATLNTWKVYDGNERIPDMASTYYETDDATYELTGVQMELGSQATPFEHRSFGEELALCQRYYQVLATGDQAVIGGGFAFQTNRFQCNCHLPVEMRTTPALDEQMTGGTKYRINMGNSDQNTGITPSLSSAVSNTRTINLGWSSLASNVTNGDGGQIRKQSDSGILGVQAEL